MTSGLDNLFDMVPAELAAMPAWRDKRNEILDGLKKDAQGLPLTTAHTMLMERMATFYTIMRKREAEDDGTPVSFSDMRNNQQQWLAMTTEFYKQVKDGEDKRLSSKMKQVEKVLFDILTLIEDPQLQKDIIKKLQQEFRKIGL